MISNKLFHKLFKIGKIIPESTDEILEFERIYLNTKFPDVSDIIPSEIIKGDITLQSESLDKIQSESNTISMAARNGKEIPQDILDKMHQDRDKAESDGSIDK